MFKHILAFALAALPVMGNAGDVTGTWRTATGETGAYLHVNVAPCASDAALTCGTIVQAFNATRDDLVGKLIIWDMQPDGENSWRRGRIWAPDDDKTYRSSMELRGEVLRVQGCVAIFCRGQDWTRVN